MREAFFVILRMDKKINIVVALIIGVSIVMAGLFVGRMQYLSQKNDRVVTVKGLSVREVNANLAIWSLQLTVANNELTVLQKSLETNTSLVQNALKAIGFDNDEVYIGAPEIVDTKAQRYGNNGQYNENRYIATKSVTLRTRDLNKIKVANGAIADLIGKGVVIGSKNQWQQIEYVFTGLNDIKPEMIKESTINARKAAEQFAFDSGSKVGKIKSANQGLFSISNRDASTQDIKQVRVVSTVNFYLED